MSRRLPAYWLPHTVVVRAFEGIGGAGPILGDPVEQDRVYTEDVREVVIDSDGTEVVSNTRFFCDFDKAPPEESLVTVWPGTGFAREAVVVKVSRYQHPLWPGYAEVRLK